MFKRINHFNSINYPYKILASFIIIIFLILSFTIFFIQINRAMDISGIFIIFEYVFLALFVIAAFAIEYIKNSSSNKLSSGSDAQNGEGYEDPQMQKKLIDELTNLNKMLIENDKKKTEFFYNISHELKTPISIILGAIQLIDAKSPPYSNDNRKTSKYYKTIKHNCYRLLRLINNVLDISKMDSGFIKLNTVNCNIVYLIEEIVQSVAPYSRQKGLILEFDTDEEEIFTAVDVDKIERIILNLLSNAIKFTPTGGKILVNINKREHSVIISIKDSGPGIPKNLHNEIFERFKQSNTCLTRENEGCGIGLSLVKSFVTMHNGNIRLISEENKGSEFIIELPLGLSETFNEPSPSCNNNQHKIIEAINIEFSDIYSFEEPSYTKATRTHA
ncbi:MAG: HAMP domain-containing sensor histidine kinase [Bacillota bacterium]|nr:HAMP domain-containing sensor histidine kinase [Bacillota bacterium]